MTMEDTHVRIAKHYGIPYTSIRDSIYRDLKSGHYALSDISPDGLHPNTHGHALIAEEIIRKVQEIAKMPSAPVPDTLPDPVTLNRFEHAERLTIRNACPCLNGFHADTREKTKLLDHFKNGWIGRRTGDAIHFDLPDIRTLAVQYRKGIHHPACVARLTLDGAKTLVLDGNFEEDWGDCLYLDDILHDTVPGHHTLDIEVTGDSDGNALPFYLMSLIVS